MTCVIGGGFRHEIWLLSAQGDRIINVGVVDSEYIIHKGTPTLGGDPEKIGRSFYFVVH
ncbi:unnamed protein product [Musa acuminata subsp. malaccensis]|uniref:(wild Malaysian banana) hypothetical protein n=1 Tax=Musa acuminata subsp. malaccensis TaxID=214687 RepID=A0A804K4B3_MUSAM|nr:unnamed protein product [Musa acuminata subsp. malaccensis]